ncbi:hypothetical protein D3C86_1388630 [compost metagenome]
MGLGGEGIEHHAERVAIGGAPGNLAGAYGAAGARAVIYHHGLRQAGVQAILHLPCDLVDGAACCIRYDDRDRPGGPVVGHDVARCAHEERDGQHAAGAPAHRAQGG